MEIEVFIKKFKDIYSVLIDFIDDDDDDSVSEFGNIINFFEKQEILENKEEIKLIIRLISKISDNHHRTSNFFDKIEKIFRYLIKNTPSPISNFISDYTKYNPRILFLLLDKKIIIPDETFINSYLQSMPGDKYFYYLYPKMKEFMNEIMQKEFEKDLLTKYEKEISTFEEKCRIGENDSYICSLIRTDSVEEFISYVNRTNLSLFTQIESSVYETNSFLINKEPTLIEYASFYGSIQIIKYLKYNKVPLTSSLWTYAIHSNNAELIHFLEENKVEPENYYGVLEESIKCHHNDISNYIKNNLYDQIQTDDQNEFYDDFNCIIYDSLNFFFFPSEIESMICQPQNNRFKLSQLCFSLTTITIPSSITSIGDYAFYGCSSLTQIIIPSSVNSIGEYSFCGCLKLTKITIPSNVTSIRNSTFYECSSLAEILISSSVTSIGNNAFYGCSSLTKITIPSSVTSIGNFAFSGCSSLTQISFENISSITSIGLFVFSECSSLTQIPIQFSNRDNEILNNSENEFINENNLKIINKQILNIQTNLYGEYASIKKLNKIIILGSTGSGTTSVSWALSGKDLKVAIGRGRRVLLELSNNEYNNNNCNNRMAEIVIDKSNKMAFIESHHLKEPYYYIDEIAEYYKKYYTQYFLKSNENEAKIKILLVISQMEIECSHGNSVKRLFSSLDEIFPNLIYLDKKAVGLVITRGDIDLEPRDYIEIMNEYVSDKEIQKWCHYFGDHLEQVFIMPNASRSMKGKSFDFEDKYKILDFIKNKHSIHSKPELKLSPTVNQVLALLQMDNE